MRESGKTIKWKVKALFTINPTTKPMKAIGLMTNFTAKEPSIATIPNHSKTASTSTLSMILMTSGNIIKVQSPTFRKFRSRLKRRSRQITI